MSIQCPKTNMCFVLMPFALEFKNQWELAFTPAIKEADLLPWRGDEESLGTNIIMRDVTKCIYDAKLIIADLTNRNPNVMYELGLAHAAKKSVIMLAQSDEDIPFDIRHIRYLKYDTRDLKKLRKDLLERIKSTISMHGQRQPDFFPELKIMSQKDVLELKYLRKKAYTIEITADPFNSDIFFNDKLIGSSPQLIKINPDFDYNTISACAPEFLEYHKEINDNDLKKGKIHINLEYRIKDESSTKMAPRWIRYRRKYPNNPVLMRAISQYLLTIGEIKESIEEINELLEVAPEWYLAHNQAGYVILYDKPLEAIDYFKKVVRLNPNSYVGYYNLACAYSKIKDYPSCIEYLTKILKDNNLLTSFSLIKKNIIHDTDFSNILTDNQFSVDFKLLADELNSVRFS